MKKIAFLLALMSLCSIQIAACPFASGHNKLKKNTIEQKERVVVDTQKLRAQFSEQFPRALNSIKSQFEKNEVLLDKALKITEDEITTSPSLDAIRGLKFLKETITILSKKEGAFSRKDYFHFMDNLRKAALSLKEGNIEIFRRWTQALSYYHFQIELNSDQNSFTSFIEALPVKYKDLSILDFNLKEFNETVAYAVYPYYSLSYLLPQVDRKIKKVFFLKWDSAQHSLRSSIAQFRINDKVIPVLRMGCPIVGVNLFSRVDPLFLSYLDHLKESGKKHLYINNQNTLERGWELRGSKLLDALAHNPKYNKTFFFISLPYDSGFYKQKNQGRVATQTFLNEFKAHLINNEEGFNLPLFLREDPQFHLLTQHLLQKIHSKHFKEQEYLDGLERRQYIDLFYAYLARDLIDHLEVDFINWTCKHGIDRAMTSLAIFEGLLRYQDRLPFTLNSTLYITYWPALSNYRRPPMSQRVVRAFSALRKFSESTDLGSVSDRELRSSFFFI